MSASDDTRTRLIAAYRAGEIDSVELQDRLESEADVDDLDSLWARWSGQGLFDRPVEQEGYTSVTQTITEEIRDDG